MLLLQHPRMIAAHGAGANDTDAKQTSCHRFRARKALDSDPGLRLNPLSSFRQIRQYAPKWGWVRSAEIATSKFSATG